MLISAQDNIIMQLRGDGLVDDDEAVGEESSATAQRVVYVLHPNCAIEEM